MTDNYKPKETYDLQRYKWEDELNLAKREGYIPKKVYNTLVSLASQMNWSKYKGELRWSNEKACERAGISTATFYRNMPLMLKSGFLGHKKGNYYAKYPSIVEIHKFRSAKDLQIRSKQYQVESTSDPWSTTVESNNVEVSDDPWSSSDF